MLSLSLSGRTWINNQSEGALWLEGCSKGVFPNQAEILLYIVIYLAGNTAMSGCFFSCGIAS